MRSEKGCIYIMRMETAKKNFDIDAAGNILLNSSQSPKDLQIQSGDTYAAMIVDGKPILIKLELTLKE